MRSDPDLHPADLFPSSDGTLPKLLAKVGAKELFESRALTRDQYSTERFLLGMRTESPRLLGLFTMQGDFTLACETTSVGVNRYCAALDLKLACDADAHAALPTISAALTEIIEPQLFLWNSVSELAWRAHVLLAHDDDYDVSFSDPSIPFSIFISSPKKLERESVLRVAENLVHETMHLQLSLFEVSQPLIHADSSWAMYSPWKQQPRPAQGILHGLYVFSVLRWMWLQVSQTTVHSEDRAFAIRRIEQINQEVDAVKGLEDSPALTAAGRKFLELTLRFAKLTVSP
jgi:hypothetical protein